jgi:hypothetical protein
MQAVSRNSLYIRSYGTVSILGERLVRGKYQSELQVARVELRIGKSGACPHSTRHVDQFAIKTVQIGAILRPLALTAPKLLPEKWQ